MKESARVTRPRVSSQNVSASSITNTTPLPPPNIHSSVLQIWQLYCPLHRQHMDLWHHDTQIKNRFLKAGSDRFTVRDINNRRSWDCSHLKPTGVLFLLLLYSIPILLQSLANVHQRNMLQKNDLVRCPALLLEVGNGKYDNDFDTQSVKRHFISMFRIKMSDKSPAVWGGIDLCPQVAAVLTSWHTQGVKVTRFFSFDRLSRQFKIIPRFT